MFVADVIEIYNYLRVLVLTMKNIDINNCCEENRSNQNVFCKICLESTFFFSKNVNAYKLKKDSSKLMMLGKKKNSPFG